MVNCKKKGGSKMENIVELLKDVIIQENEKLRQEMNQRFEKVEQEMKQMQHETSQKFEQLQQGTNKRFEQLQQEMSQKFCEMAKKFHRIEERMTGLEEDYGTKINAIFEFVEYHQEENLKRFDRINHLEKRISILEKNQV